MSLSKEERDDLRACVWSDQKTVNLLCDDLDAKDAEIKSINIHFKAADQLIGMKNQEIEKLKARVRS